MACKLINKVSLLLFLSVGLICCAPTVSFSPPPSFTRRGPVTISTSSISIPANRPDIDGDPALSSPPPSLVKYLHAAGLVSSVLSWCTIAYVALSRHPTPAVHAAASTRHNVFTIAQALAFPVPVLVAVFGALIRISMAESSSTSTASTYRRLNLGLAVASLWTAASVVFGPTFSAGYDLFSKQIPLVRYGCPAIHSLTACFAFFSWKRSVPLPRDGSGGFIHPGYYVSRIIRGLSGSIFVLLNPSSPDKGADLDDPDNIRQGTALYSLASLGLLLLALMPQFVPFPTATIPTLLGKRLSRAASGFTFLGSAGTYCLVKDSKRSIERGKEVDNSIRDEEVNAMNILRRGLGIGALLHVGLVIAKLIGFDGGGLLLPGRGLWQDYPSLVKASPAATATMIVTYSILSFAALGGR